MNSQDDLDFGMQIKQFLIGENDVSSFFNLFRPASKSTTNLSIPGYDPISQRCIDTVVSQTVQGLKKK